MSNWLAQVVNDFSELVGLYPAIILFIVVVLILISLTWVWLKVSAIKVDTEPSNWWSDLLAWLTSNLKTFWTSLMTIIRQLIITSKDVYEEPLYLLFKPASDESSFSSMPLKKTRRAAPDFLQRLLLESGDDKWYFLKGATLVELPVDVKEVKASEEHKVSDSSKSLVQKVISKIVARRPQRPLDGILVSIPASQLAAKNDHVLIKLAERMALDLCVIDSEVPFALPVYVIVSHCEDIVGFNAFAQQNWEQHEQIFGWSSDVEFGEKHHRNTIARAFDYIHDLIIQNQVVRSATQPSLIQGDQYILLDQKINELEPGVGFLCDKLFDSSLYKNGFFFRGVYFTGRSFNQNSANRPSQNIFIDDLLEKKISAESNLAVPTGRGLIGHKRLLDRYKQVSSVMLVLLVVLGGWSLWSLHKQMNSVATTLKSIESTGLSARGGYSQVYEVLDQLSAIDARRFNRIGLPISWFSSVDDNLIQVISDKQFKATVFPAMECRLGQNFKSLLRYTPQFSELSGTAGFRWVFAEAWLLELETFHTSRHSFIELSEPSTDQNSDILTQFSNLIYQLYNAKPSAGFFERNELYRMAMEKLDYPYNSVNPKCPDGSTGVDKQSSTLFWDQVSDYSTQFYTYIQSSSLSPTGLLDIDSFLRTANANTSMPDTQQAGEEYVLLDRWFNYLDTMWLGENRESNPCREIRDRLLDIQINWDNHTPQSMGVAAKSIALFEKQNCEEAFYGQLLRNKYSVLSQPFVRDNSGNVQFSPTLAAFRGNYSSVQNLTFMSVDTTKLPGSNPEPIFWDNTRLLSALGYYKEYERYAKANFDNGLKLPPKEKAEADAYALQSGMIEQLVNVIRYELEWAKHGTLPSSDNPLNSIVSSEQQVLDAVNNFTNVVESFYQLRDILAQLGYTADSQAWLTTTRASAQSILQRIDELAAYSRLYKPTVLQDSTDVQVLSGLYGISSKAELSDYLITQYQRASYIAYNYAQNIVTYLLNSMPDPASGRTMIEQRWQDTLFELDKYARKDPNNALDILEKQFSTALGITVNNCPSKHTAGASRDIFTQAQTELAASIMTYCDQVKADESVANYDWVVAEFNRSLKGRYPFADIASKNAGDVSVASVRNFFNRFDQFSADLLTELTTLEKQDPSYKDAKEFVSQLISVSDFFADSLKLTNDAGSGSITTELVFRVFTNLSIGTDQIISQSLETNGQAVTMPGKDRQLKWEYGAPLTFSARLANLSTYKLSGSSSDQVRIDGSKISFSESGNWGLLRLLQRYRVSPGAQATIPNPGSVVLEFPVRVKKTAALATANSLTTPPLVSSVIKLAVGVNLYGFNATTKQLELLEFPDSFPFSAPTL